MKTKQKNNKEQFDSPAASTTFTTGKLQDVEKLFLDASESQSEKQTEFTPIYCPFSKQTIKLKPFLTALDLRSLIEATIEDNITPYDFYKTAFEIVKSLQDPEQKDVNLNHISFYDFCIILYYYKLQLVADPAAVTLTQPNGESVIVDFDELLKKINQLSDDNIRPLDLVIDTTKGIPVRFVFHYPTIADQIQYYKIVNTRFVAKIPELKNALKKEGSLLSLFTTTKADIAGSVANKELLRTILNISMFVDLARVLKKIFILHSKTNPEQQDVVVDVQNLSLESREELLQKLDAKTITILSNKVPEYIKNFDAYFTTNDGIDVLPHQKLFTN